MSSRIYRRNKKSKKKCLLIFLSLLIIVVIVVILFFLKSEFSKNEDENKIIEEKVTLNEIKNSYSKYVSLKNGTILYKKENDKYISAVVVNGEILEELDGNYEIIDEYFKLLNSDYYVKYDSIVKVDSIPLVNMEYKYYKNYIPYNENVILNDNSKLFVDDINYYKVDGGEYAIIIKDTDKYGIEINDRLVYVRKSDVKEIISSSNTNQEITEGISVFNYHFVVDANEMKSCAQSICLLEEKFDSQIKYLKDNGYYSVSMRDLELFIDGKIQLPKKSVSITIDDGWYVQRSISILEKYQILGTLFLIGNLASPSDYNSDYLEIHSHTWDMHGLKTGDDCPNSSFRGGITCFDEEKILEDLRRSRESLNNTTYFCYPFYDYNNKSIELLKKAGFTMAFSGNQKDNKVRVGTDKFRIPRYIIYSNTSLNTFINYVS